jgi:phosphoribosylaminoimidazole-succinocarboxamide synthase
VAGVGEAAAAPDDKPMSMSKPANPWPQEGLDMPHSVVKPRNLNLLARGGSNHRSLIGDKHPFAFILSSPRYSMPNDTLVSLDLPGLTKLRSGKVREVFDLGETLLFVATDRLSAFDVILPDPIPDKGAVLNQISTFWFERIQLAPSHFITADFARFPTELQPFRAQLAGRSMIVRRTKPLPVECVVRGYLAGSGWNDYQATGGVCGHELPAGLRLASELPEPIFTPSTKNEAGHDLNIDWAQCCELIGQPLARQVRDLSLRIYLTGKEHAAKCGIIVADTKFEFGLDGKELLLIDECLTPDSSRFWPADSYAPGKSPPSFDKQFVRDYLETLDWNKTSPGPALPKDVIEKTSAKYREAFRRLTSNELA